LNGIGSKIYCSSVATDLAKFSVDERYISDDKPAKSTNKKHHLFHRAFLAPESIFIDKGKGARKAGTEGRVYLITKAWVSLRYGSKTSTISPEIDVSRGQNG